MAFDLSTAKPAGGFDLSTASPAIDQIDDPASMLPNGQRNWNAIEPKSGKTYGQLRSELEAQHKTNIANRNTADANANRWNAVEKALGYINPLTPIEGTREGLHDVATGGRAIGVGGIKGVTGLGDLALAVPTFIGNQGIKAYDALRSPSLTELVTGKKDHTLPYFPLTNAVSRADEKYLADPLNTAQTAGGRIAANTAGSVSGALLTAGLGEYAAGAQALPSSVQKVGQFLAASPKAQAIAAGTGGAASQTVKEMGGGEGAQLAAGFLGSMAPGGLKYGLKKLAGAPNAEAQTLINKGVVTTPGQNNQGGWLSQMEDAAQDWPVIGGMVKKAKEGARNQAKEAWMLDAAAPGQKIEPTGDLQHTFEKLGEGFDNAYEVEKGYPLKLQNGKPVIFNAGKNEPLADAVKKAVFNRSIDATNGVRKSAHEWLSDQLTRSIKTSDDLFNIRSTIRQRIRKLSSFAQTENTAAKIELLHAAEEKIQDALNSQLPKGVVDALKPIDAQYAKYKIVNDAMRKAGDRAEGFTLNEMSNAAKKSGVSALGQRAYAEGEGAMRDIPKAGLKVFMETPATGARAFTNTALKYAAPVIIPASFMMRNYLSKPAMSYQPPISALASALANRQMSGANPGQLELTPEQKKNALLDKKRKNALAGY